MGAAYNELSWRGVSPIPGIDGIWPARNSTRVNERAVNEAAGDVIVYTVPAGRKMYLSNLNMSAFLPENKESRARVTVRNEGDVLQYVAAEIRYGAAGQVALPCSFYPALELLAGWDIVLTNEDL